MASPRYSSIYRSPCGDLVLAGDGESLTLCDWACVYTDTELACFAAGETDGVLRLAAAQLDGYFAGQRRDFTVPLAYSGTPLQRQVQRGLSMLERGKAITYKEMAARVGRPTAVRAVASAVGANVLSIFLPCHLVIGSDGALRGYRGGLDAKRYLLTLEAAL